MDERTHSFGYWLRRRRKALDLTQQALAQQASCSGFTIRKIEADERRPSRRLAERLAETLAIAPANRGSFLAAARALQGADRLPLDTAPNDGPNGAPGAGSAASPGAASPAAAWPATPSPAAAPPAAATEIAPFVGRRAEYDLLTGLVTGLAAGAGGAVLIEGEAGVGKSRLLREVARHAQGLEATVLATKCYEFERSMPYQPVIDLLTRTLARMPADALGSVAPVALAELAALVPEIGERHPNLPRLSNDFPQARQARLARSVGQLLEAAVGAGGGVLIVDDIQWADAASAQVLHQLARHAPGRPLLAIYAYRDEDADSDETLARLIESLCRDAGARRVHLERFDPAESAALVAALADHATADPELVARLHRETQGNPFFLTSILQSLAAGEAAGAGPAEAGTGETEGLLPDALRNAVRARLAHVPKPFRAVLETGAVLGRHFDFDTLLEVTREPEDRLLEAVEALVRRHLLREEPEGGAYDFSHDKVREVVLREIGGARRRTLHLAVAEVLERRAEGEAPERAAQLAEHYERAHAWPNALHYLLLAGERSQALFAMRDALHWFDRAAALCEAQPAACGADRLLAIHQRRGAARAQAGQTQGAVEDIRRVVEAARARGERDHTRDALVQLGMAYRRADAYDDATACLSEALAESQATHDDHQAADTLYHLGTVAWSTGRNDRAIEFHRQAVELCERHGYSDLVAVQAYHGRGEAHFANAEPAAAIACYTRSLALARAIGDKSYESENLMMIGHACVGTKGLGDYPRAQASFIAALSIARAADLQWHLGPTLLGLDHTYACTGHYGQAWSGMRKTLGWLEQAGQTRYQLIAHDALAHLLLDLGRDELAVEQLERALALAGATGIGFWCTGLTAHLQLARSRLGRPVDAAALDAALDQTRRMSERYLLVRCLDAAAEIALAAGDANGCARHADELLAIAGPNGLRELEAAARRWRGEALLACDEHAAARIELAHAAALADDVGRVRLQRDTQAALARALVALGARDDAQPHDSRARELAQRMQRSLASCEPIGEPNAAAFAEGSAGPVA